MSPIASNSTVFLVLTGIITLVVFGPRTWLGHDPREPPLAPQSIPLIGHIVGLSRRSFNYYVELSRRTGLPVFTMALPGQKMYVVTSPDLIQTIQKQPRTLAFPPIAAKFTAQICGASPKAQAILDVNTNGEEGDWGALADANNGMRAALKPGPGLDDMNRTMIREVARSLDELQPARGESVMIDMYAWLRGAVTTATTRSVYGPMNPYEDKEVADAFWVFERGLMSFILGFPYSLISRKPTAARTKVATALKAYYKAGGLKEASAFAKNRYQVGIKNDIPLDDTAGFEVSGSLAVLVNTAPACFWTLLLLHSHPGLLDDIRQEVDACTETTKDEQGTTVKTLDITTLKEECPLLLSAYQEVLRFCSMGTSVREVMEDTYLDHRWLLKKGAMLQMPSRVIHQDTSLWGDSAADFQPRRFLAEEKKNRPKDVCFRAFGGGKTLCPGRHFATNEVLSVVALSIARLELKPAGGAAWKLPTTDNTGFASVVMEPDHDIRVDVSTRKGYEDVRWDIRLNKEGKTFAMVTEDMEEGSSY